MRVVLLKDKKTIRHGGMWPYRFENVHYFGIDFTGRYVVVYGTHTIYTETVDDSIITSFVDYEED